MNIPEEIEAFSDPEERADLLLVFDAYHWQGEWPAVARCEFVDFNSRARRKWRLTPVGKAVASQHRNAERVRILREALADNLQAWEGEEESVREEHADLIEETRAAIEATEEET